MTRNAGYLLVSRLASAGTTLVVLFAVARLRGVDAVGAVAIGFAIGAITASVSDLGIGSLLVREVARQPARAGELLGVAVVYRIIAIPICLVVAAALAAIAFPTTATPVMLVVGGLVAQQAAELTRAPFIAAERMSVYAAHAVAENLLWAAAISAILALGLDLRAALLGGLVVMIGSVVVGLVLDAWLLHAVPAFPRRRLLRALLPTVGPFAAFNIVGIAYSRIDTVLVGLLLPAGAVAAAGVYFASTRLVAVFEYLPDAISRAIFPELSRRGAAGADMLSILRPASDRLVAIGVIVPGLLIVGGSWILPAILGQATGVDGWIVGVLALAIPMRFLGYLYGTTLTSTDAQTRRVVAAVTAFAVVVSIDAALIPTLGVVGAVAGAIAGSGVVALVYGLSVARRFGGLPLSAPAVVIVLAAAVLATSAGLLLRDRTGEVLAMAITAAVYVAAVSVSPVRWVLTGRPRPTLAT